MNIIGVIPARMAATRFPGKPLAKILDRPMIHHVYWRSRMADILNDVYIATCDKEIESYCLDNDIKVIMTKATHERASDRAAEAMLNIEQKTRQKIDIVVMTQGDEPMLQPEMIDLAVNPMLEDNNILVTNLMARLKNRAEEEDPNAVKVVADRDNFALYFSREPIPSGKKAGQNIARYKQVPIIPFRRDFLITFNELPQTYLEIIESVDMLRILEHGYKVKMVISEFDTYSVDTPEDLMRVEEMLRHDPLVSKYNHNK